MESFETDGTMRGVHGRALSQWWPITRPSRSFARKSCGPSKSGISTYALPSACGTWASLPLPMARSRWAANCLAFAFRDCNEVFELCTSTASTRPREAMSASESSVMLRRMGSNGCGT